MVWISIFQATLSGQIAVIKQGIEYVLYSFAVHDSLKFCTIYLVPVLYFLLKKCMISMAALLYNAKHIVAYWSLIHMKQHNWHPNLQ